MNTIEVLVKARAVIEPEGTWAKNALAYDEYGHMVDSASPKAVCWCAEGAVEKVITEAAGPEATEETLSLDCSEIYTVLRKVISAKNIPTKYGTTLGSVNGYNDHPETTHTDILKVFDDAIEAEKARPL